MAEIIVGMDGSEGAAQALQWAAQESKVRGEPLVAVLVWGYLNQHHVDPKADFDPEYTEADARAALSAYVERALGPDAPVELRTVDDLPGRGLVDAAHGASMLVVGARGLGGFKELLIGSVSRYCLHHAPCPVAVVRRGTTEGIAGDRKVVVGVDGSVPSDTALAWAADEAARRGSALEVVHAWQPPLTGTYPHLAQPTDFTRFEQDAQQLLDEEVRKVPASAHPTGVLALGSAANAVLTAADDADLVVVGTRGATGLERLFIGSTSSQVVHHARCPVVVVPPETDR